MSRSRLARSFFIAIILCIVFVTLTPQKVSATPSVSNIVVTEEYYTMRVDFRLTTDGDYQTVVFEEEVVIFSGMSVAASNQDRWRDWTKGVAMKGLHWAIRLTDDSGVRWINGTYEKGAELVTFHGISTSNVSIAFHVEATLECDISAYRDGVNVYSGNIGANFATIEFVRNGSVGTHTYNITFAQRRFQTHDFYWQLDHEDIIAEQLAIPTNTVTITNTVIVTQTVTITITETEIVTVIEYVTITITETRTETILVPGSTPLEIGLGTTLGGMAGAFIVLGIVLLRSRKGG
ncbi:MAG: hypothetical protein ACFFER_08630 [Candidatus Thorarchaeota archaeon]